MAYHKIVQVGAAGNVGTPIHNALVKSGKFDITVIGRESSTFTSSDPSVKVVKVDYSNKQQLVSALKGADAVVLTLGGLPELETHSKAIIDAAIEAGVKRVLPSEYGGVTNSGPGRDAIAFTAKKNINDYLSEKSDSITFTSIATGPFFDWGLVNYSFLGFDIPAKKVTLYSGGDAPFNSTTLETVGESVVAVLSNPEKFKNKFLKVSDFQVSQKDILAVLEAETGSKFEVIKEVDADKLAADTEAALRAGDWSIGTVSGSIVGTVFSSKAASKWGPNDDTASLGIPKKDLKTELKKVLAGL